MTGIGQYLLARLHQQGLEHIFGVPSDYVLRFYAAIAASPIRHVGTTREDTAAFAADGYARCRGIGALAVTYGVGALNVVNAVAGAHAESSPVETLALLEAARAPVLLAGLEVHRRGLQPALMAFVERTRLPVAATLTGKLVVAERHPGYLGVYEGAMSADAVRRAVEQADCVLLLGVTLNDVDRRRVGGDAPARRASPGAGLRALSRAGQAPGPQARSRGAVRCCSPPATTRTAAGNPRRRPARRCRRAPPRRTAGCRRERR